MILKPVNRSLALLAAFWRLVYAFMWVLMTLNLFDPLRLLSGADYLQVFDAERLQALARLSLSVRFDQYYVGLLFYALASTVCSHLWFKSNYIPKALAVWGVISSAFCAACTFAFIIFPNFAKAVNLWWFDSPGLPSDLLRPIPSIIRINPFSLYCASSVWINSSVSPDSRKIRASPDHLPIRKPSFAIAARCASISGARGG